MVKVPDPPENLPPPYVNSVPRQRALRLHLSVRRVLAKAGAGCDAPQLWRDGRFEQLARYCERDVRALAELVLRDVMRVGHGETREAEVGGRLEGLVLKSHLRRMRGRGMALATVAGGWAPFCGGGGAGG